MDISGRADHVEAGAGAGEVDEEPTVHPRPGLGCITDVLFPATPPIPVNARVIRRLGLEEEKKGGGLASAAGLMLPKRAEPGSG